MFFYWVGLRLGRARHSGARRLWRGRVGVQRTARPTSAVEAGRLDDKPTPIRQRARTILCEQDS
jgi:hypothetical protein